MRVMRNMKVAPSQMHLGAWAFIRGFERADFLFASRTPSYKLFFHLFEVQHTQGLCGRGLVSLKGKGLLVLHPFSDTYPGFKDNYLRVIGKEKKDPFWVQRTPEGPTLGLTCPGTW